MPLTTFVPEALGVVTICLVALLVLLGLFCIIYLFYFRSHIRNQGCIQLGYFSGPWIIRITFILFAILCGFGEIIRLSLLRQQGRVLNALNWKWQETVCKCYIVSNLGFTEPCLFLTLVFLLRASLQKSESNTFSQKWNGKTAVYVLLYCLPMFLFQLTVILLGPHFNKGESLANKLPHYFTRTAARSKTTDQHHIALCTYPLLSTILLGLFATVITTYLFLLGRRILNLVINKGLQKRVYTLIFSISGFLPLRVLFLGLSVLSRPEQLPFEALAFCAFLSLLCCAGVGIFMLVYYPVADSLSLRSIPEIDARRSNIDEHNDMLPLIAIRSRLEEEIEECSTGKWESISLQAMEREDSSEAFVELSLLSPSQLFTPPASPRWPVFPPIHVHGLGKQKGSDNHC